MPASAAQSKVGRPIEPKLPKFELDTFRDKGYLTHGLHPYPAKFVPQIPQLLLRELAGPSDVVLDPFCGSGTTLVEAALIGATPIGVDSNALAVKIARAKTTILSESLHAELVAWFEDLATLDAAFRAGAATIEPVIPEFKNRRHWFTDHACVELGLIKALLSSRLSDVARNVLEVVFSSIIVKCSRQESDTRWCAVDKPFATGDALNLMQKRLLLAIDRLNELRTRVYSSRPARVYCANTRNMTHIATGSVDAIVTSPPYLNSFDYYLYHKLRMFWLDIDHYPIQDAEIGSRNKHCDNKEGIEMFSAAMSDCVAEFARVIKPTGTVTLVVGDSVYRGELVPMDVLYEDLMQQHGFRLLNRFSFNQRKYTRAFTPNIKTLEKNTHIMLFGG